VELQTLVGKESRVPVDYDQIPEDLINAFVAIEDKRFWNHHGVDWRGTAAGLAKLFTGGNIRGGSTIDQQLIKNETEYDDVTVTRKILEIFTALELEKNYGKEEILTFYMNKIWMGNGCRGVQAASRYYFGKDVWDLDLAECASLAGITNNPSLYAPKGVVDVVLYQCKTPGCGNRSLTKDEVCDTCGEKNSFDNGSVWTNREYNKWRQELILREMAKEDEAREAPYITEAERDAAIAETLVFRWDKQETPEDPDQQQPEEQKSSVRYSWYVEQVISESIKVLQEQTGRSWDYCEAMVLSGGLSIICAYDPEVQAAVDSVFNDRSNLDVVSSKSGQRLMSNITVVDNSNGYVVALGSTAEKTLDRGSIWPVTTLRQPGSSIKPLSVYAPAIDMGLISPATVIDDNPQSLNGKVWPTNSPPGYRGLTTVLDGVTRSVNTVALRVLDMVTPQASYEFLEDKFGITSLESYYVTPGGEVKSDMDRSPLSMGGLTWGVSTFEMAAAYATFPRNGEFKKATTVLEIRDRDQNVLVDNRPEPKYVIKSTTASYINSILTNVIAAGTGRRARLSGMTAAGKTGTTNSKFDLWFCGYTPYYTAAVWTGYPNSERIGLDNPSIPMWQKVMSKLHEGLEDRAFSVPEEQRSYRICLDCGKLATDACANDIRGDRTQNFRLFPGDAPKETCSCHVPVRVCVDSPILNADGAATGRYHLAGELCPEESVRTIYMVDHQRELASPSVSVGDADALLGWYDSLPEEGRYCGVHVEGWEPLEPTESLDVPVPPSDVPVNSGEPAVTDPPYVEPTLEPWPTIEPPQPSYDPLPPPSADVPYVPVDEWGNPLG